MKNIQVIKNILSAVTMLIAIGTVTAQVGVETDEVRGDGIMDFPSPATKGILLPLVDDNTAVPVAGGAMVFNVDTKQVEYYDTNPASSGWKAMTGASTTEITGPEHAGSSDRFTELDPTNGTIIEAGTVTQTPPVGVLVLESDNKALILPQVADATQLPGPKAGMICYDMASDSIAVFNGTVWSFWN